MTTPWKNADGFRVHAADEEIATVLNPERPDGWVASDEAFATQPHGVSVCCSLRDMARYIREYGMAVRPGDRLLALRGTHCGEDRDQWASRMEVSEVLCEVPMVEIARAYGRCPVSLCPGDDCAICGGVEIDE